VVDPLLEQALACVDDFYGRIFRNWPGAVTRVVGDCTLSYSGDTRLTGANHLWPQHPDALNDDVLADGAQFFAIYRAAWSVVLTDTYMPDWVERLEASVYYGRWSTPLMVLTDPPLYARRNPSSRVVRATTRQHIADAGRVMFRAFAWAAAQQPHGRPNTSRQRHPALSRFRGKSRRPARRSRYTRAWRESERRHTLPFGASATRHPDIAILDDLRGRGICASMQCVERGLRSYERLGYRSIGPRSTTASPSVRSLRAADAPPARLPIAPPAATIKAFARR